jgi:diadenylate cyclase
LFKNVSLVKYIQQTIKIYIVLRIFNDMNDINMKKEVNVAIKDGIKEDTKERFVITQIKVKEEPKKLSFLEFLSKLSPGKSLRIALDDIKRGRSGALLVVNGPLLKNLYEGGFRVNCKFTPQKIAELAKMDGAIIISQNLKKILFANALLVPDTRIPSEETGTRHKAAERTSVQAETPIIAVSERRGKISLFYDNRKYVLQDSETLLRRSTENLHILEKQKEIFTELLTNLNILEMTNLVSISDVCSLLQRMEIITRVRNTLKRSMIELGNEGAIIQMRIRELVKGVDKTFDMILRDYLARPNATKRLLASINFDGLLDTNALVRILFEESSDKQVSPKGYRLLRNLNLTERELNSLVSNFKNIDNIFNANDEELGRVLRQKVESFKEELKNLKEQIMVGKKI